MLVVWLTGLGAALAADAGGSPRIVGGAPVEASSWPSIAALYAGDSLACTGVLVREDAVLTAGHCGTFGLDRAVIGRTEPASDAGVAVAQVVSHPAWSATYDLALVLLAEPVEAPVMPLAPPCIAALSPGATVEVAGFGAVDPDGRVFDGRLHEAWLEVHDPDCRDPGVGCNAAIAPGGELVLGGDGVDACVGDSGAPVVVDGALVAVVSRGLALSQTLCGEGGIAVRPDRAWLDEALGEPLEVPACPNGPDSPSEGCRSRAGLLPLLLLALRRRVGIALLATGCVVIEPEPSDRNLGPVTLADLWDAGFEGAVRIDGLTVTSPRTASGDLFYVQDADGLTAAAVRPGGVLDGWPPPVGTVVQLSVTHVLTDDGPELWLARIDDGVVVGERTPTVVEVGDEPVGPALVRMRGVRVISDVDPAGRADCDGPWDLEAAFDLAPPGWDAAGTLIGLRTAPDRVSIRGPGDAVGMSRARGAVDATLDALVGLDDGTPMRLDGLVQITPWSRDGRFAVVQDETGRGLWLDAEAWGTPSSASGDRIDLRAELRRVDGAPFGRVWTEPEVLGVGAPRVVETITPGSLRTVGVSGLGPADAFGARSTTEGWVLDDRFLALDALPDPARVEGVLTLDGALAVLAADPI